MKIGILTFHRAFNCGAMLQAWALQHVLTQMGHDVSFPNCNDVGYPIRFKFTRPTLLGKFRNLIGWVLTEILCFPLTDLKHFRFNRFLKRFLRTVSLNESGIGSKYDLIVVGSDQVWHERIAQPNVALFLGETLPKHISMVGYALSWGDATPSPEHLTRLKQATQRFSYLTMREPYAIPTLQSLTYKPIYQVVDPALLLKAKDYEPLILQKRLVKQPYMVVYIIKRSELVLQKVQQIADALGVKLVLIDVYRFPREKCNTKNTWAVSPDRFLNYIKHAECVIASSFHGCVFSTLFKKPFVFLTNEPEKKETRPAVLLESLNQTSRICSPEMPLQILLKHLQTPLPTDIENRLDQLATESKSKLLEMLSYVQH